MKIADLLRTTPNDLLSIDSRPTEPPKRTVLYDRLLAAAKVLKDSDLEVAAIQAEAVAVARRR